MESKKNIYSKRVDTIENITRIDFSIYSNSDIVKYSAISDPNGITVAEINNNGEAVQGGVVDQRLGVTDRSELCGTCGESALTCPGHFGHIKFTEPVFHSGYLLHVKNIIKCVCIRCNKLLVYKNEEEIAKLLKNKQGKQRFAEIRNICKSVTHCQKDNYGCGIPAHKIKIEKKHDNILILAEPYKKTSDNSNEYSKKSQPQILTPQLCYDILKGISDKDYEIMGYDPKKSRPENMIICNFPVPPKQVRPSVGIEINGASSKEDGLTNELIGIIKNNENLKNAKGDGSLYKTSGINDDFTLLQLHVAAFFANDSPGLSRSQQKNKQVTKSLSERLKGKEGRIRGNLMGKRVDMSGRTVITSDPYIRLNEVGVPLIIAKNLTYPEIVTKHNIDYLRKLVTNGQRAYPGAKSVIKHYIDASGNEAKGFYSLKHNKVPIQITPGNIVERHLVNGDMIFFNRQPSLHKLSMMGHMCHILNNPTLLTFRVNVSVTGPYNADFDGDEMNVHCPQSIQTAVELRLITNAAKRFVSPSTSSVVISAVQDTVMGSYVLTKQGSSVDWKDMMNILMMTSTNLMSDIPKNKMLSGKILFSDILPSDLNIIKKDGNEYIMNIRNGELLDGVINKSKIKQIIQKLWFQNGSNDTMNFVDDLQHIILQYLMIKGYTIGIKDMTVPKKALNEVKKLIETVRKDAMGEITEYENDPSVMTSEAFEKNMTQTLSRVLNDTQKIIMNNFSRDSGIYNCISSGSSGLDMNAGQIVACIGQVIVEGKRIQRKFNNRTLPVFPQFDDSPFARAFCYNSFLSGLNPYEFFFQVMAGREGVIDTAIKTAETGYVQRKLVKILEDIKVEYDGSVRNANDKFIQYIYGDNGINTEKQVDQKIELLRLNNESIKERYIYTPKEIATLIKKHGANEKYTTKVNDALYHKLLSMRNKMRKIQSAVNMSAMQFNDSYKMPVDLQQKITNIINRKDRKTTDIVDPYYVLTRIKEMYTGKSSKIFKYNENTSSIKKTDEEKVKLLLKFYLYGTLIPKKCTHHYKFSTEEFEEIVEYFHENIVLAYVESGEMVGFIGAHSIGEPVTQANLKSFHKSGTGKTVTGGLARIKELLSVTQNPKTPVMEVILDDEYQTNKTIALKIASNLKHTIFKDIVELGEIYYEPNPSNKSSMMYKDDVTNIFECKQGKKGLQSDIGHSPWLLRLVLSKAKMIDYNITMLEIKTSFCHNWLNRNEDSKGTMKDYKKVIDKITKCTIITNFDNSETPIVHIRFDATNYSYNTLIKFQELIVEKFKIKGIDHITDSADVAYEKYIDYDEEGTLLEGDQSRQRYVIRTDGINFQEIALINGINLLKTRCNNIPIIYEIFGVEAARAAFIREFLVAIDTSGSYSNYQHIELLADAITHMGGLIAVNRFGANKLDTDPFSRASFEKTVEQLLAAAAFAESDHIRSVSAKIMVGSLINGGTGCFDLLLDHDMIKTSLEEIHPKSSKKLIKNKTSISDLIKKKKK